MSNIPAVMKSSFEVEQYLRPVGTFYICTSFDEAIAKPPRIIIMGHEYYRFMNYVYTPQPPENLPPEKVIEICDLRLDYINQLVNYELNSKIAASLARYVKSEASFLCFDTNSKVKTLDFGCGSGLSSKLLLAHLPALDIVGVDISEKAVEEARKNGVYAIKTDPGASLPFEDATFDMIFAVFVMHFGIEVSTLAELRRVLQTSGKFVFNLYQRNVNGVKQQLREAGFYSIDVITDLPGIARNHMIVSCS
jgi:SAM-dependent methyltransferase